MIAYFLAYVILDISICFLDNDMITRTLHNVKWKIKNWDKIDVEALWNAIPIKEHNTDITWTIEKSGNYK